MSRPPSVLAPLHAVSQQPGAVLDGHERHVVVVVLGRVDPFDAARDQVLQRISVGRDEAEVALQLREWSGRVGWGQVAHIRSPHSGQMPDVLAVRS